MFDFIGKILQTQDKFESTFLFQMIDNTSIYIDKKLLLVVSMKVYIKSIYLLQSEFEVSTILKYKALKLTVQLLNWF